MSERSTYDLDRSDLARRRWLASARAERETERKAVLDTLIETHRRAGVLQQWIDDFAPRAAAAQDARLVRLLEWARSELAVLDDILDPRRLSGDLQARNLFPQTDPLHDPLGEPPPAHVWGW